MNRPITLAAIRPGSPYFWIAWNYTDERNMRFRRAHTSCVQFFTNTNTSVPKAADTLPSLSLAAENS